MGCGPRVPARPSSTLSRGLGCQGACAGELIADESVASWIYDDDAAEAAVAALE
jgi:hypothetical protein